jgi:hypothetical protein
MRAAQTIQHHMIWRTPCSLHRFIATAKVPSSPILSPWWWRCYVPLKCQFLQEPRDVISQETALFIVTAVSTSILTLSTNLKYYLKIRLKMKSKAIPVTGPRGQRGMRCWESQTVGPQMAVRMSAISACCTLPPINNFWCSFLLEAE